MCPACIGSAVWLLTSAGSASAASLFAALRGGTRNQAAEPTDAPEIVDEAELETDGHEPVA